MAQLLDELVSWGRIEDVVLNRDILVIELVQKAKRRYVFGVRAEPCLTEFPGNELGELVSTNSQFGLYRAYIQSLYVLNRCPLKLSLAITVEDGIYFIIRKLA